MLKHRTSGYTIIWLKIVPGVRYLANASNAPRICELWKPDWIWNLKWRWSLTTEKKLFSNYSQYSWNNWRQFWDHSNILIMWWNIDWRQSPQFHKKFHCRYIGLDRQMILNSQFCYRPSLSIHHFLDRNNWYIDTLQGLLTTSSVQPY